ncbi:sensor histidine kinase [Salinimicrobium marinum]|uniref:sensor histidine kinase n=1 Tax=Salinimicrobium marinum TaxID=680283 RepID=UPI00167BCA44|nr:histidine kinase [Salinimicrobium marinum]
MPIAFGGGAVLISCFLFGYWQYNKRRVAQEAGKIADYQARVAETELKALRAQMNPHFIFNSLNAIRYYMGENDIAAADDYLVMFANLTRSILENSEKKYISIAEEIRILKLYIEAEMLRMPESFNYEINVSKDIDQQKTLIPPMLIQPLVENSIWHGFAKNENDKGFLQLEVCQKNGNLYIMIDDNGAGRKNHKVPAGIGNSMGLRLTENRLKILNHYHRENGSLKILDKKKGTRVEISLPLQQI